MEEKKFLDLNGLKIVVNNNIVGNDAISSTSFAYNALNNIISATAILSARRISSSHDGIEIIKKIMYGGYDNDKNYYARL